MDNNEEVFKKVEKYFSILKKVLSEEEMASIESFDTIRLSVCPRGLTATEGGTAGGLLNFSLDVALTSKSIADSFGVEVKQAVKVALLHELGRMGSLWEESKQLYNQQDSDWHRDKLGQNYKYNPDCERMNIGHRTLEMLQGLGIKLNREEFIAILTSQGFHLQENAFYATSAPRLAHMLQAARSIVALKP